jgi:inorganic triphosphatase YgiF
VSEQGTFYRVGLAQRAESPLLCAEVPVVEIELKFQLPAGALAAIRAEVMAAGGQVLALRAAYLDTPERHLAAARAALRLRLEGEHWVQTLKAQGASAMHRLEHNVPCEPAPDGGRPALSLARHLGTPAAKALATALGLSEAAFEAVARSGATAGLALTFETDIQRTLARVPHAGSLVELALDEGAIRAEPGRSLPVCELELELCEGEVAGLIALASTWVQRHGLWLDVRSKAERGECLARGLACSAATPPQPASLAGDASPEACRLAIQQALQPVLANASVLADEGLAAPALQAHFLREHLRHWHRSLGLLHKLLGQAQLAGADADPDPAWAETLMGLLAPLDAGAGPTPAAAGRVARSPVFTQLMLALMGWTARG